VEVSVFDALERRLNEYRDEVSEYISGGGVKSMEDYNRLIGKLEGIDIALNNVKELEKRFIEA
jgi:hypothetical protein|tara:strand:+ start:16718 stop:16906 length:189 start_codon:yes stop_codon:yes gene_type:complete